MYDGDGKVRTVPSPNRGAKLAALKATLCASFATRHGWRGRSEKRNRDSVALQVRVGLNVCRLPPANTGITLIELVVFIVIVSVALGALVSALGYYIRNSVDPVVQIRALECAQAKLDEIVARKFDENSPTSGIPACGSAEIGAVPCAGIVADAAYDDVGDFDGEVDNSKSNCTTTVSVVNAGTDLGVANDQVRRITVTAVSPIGGNAMLTTYRANF
jgi:MSHA pilin protein MshD